MKKFFITTLLCASLVATSLTIIPSVATAMPTNFLQTSIASTNIFNNAKEDFKISSTYVDSATGTTNMNIKFNREEFNSTLIILDNNREVFRTKILPSTSELNIPLTLNSYGNHNIRAYVGICAPNFDAYSMSNRLDLGFFNPKMEKSIELKYDYSKNQFNANFFQPQSNCQLYVYDNGVLAYKTKLNRPTENISFALPMKGYGKHEITAYVGIQAGEYDYSPFSSSNTTVIYK